MKTIREWLSRKPRIKPPHPSSCRHQSELWAANWLLKQGLQQIEHNYQIRGGELDLIMQDQKTLVFVEVRYRQDTTRGLAAETVDRHKQGKLLRAARHYLQQTGSIDRHCRFDVLCLCQNRDGSVTYQWYKNAFGEN
jgi:putative endonuclease